MKIAIKFKDVGDLKDASIEPVEGDFVIVFEHNLPKVEINKENIQTTKYIRRLSEREAEEESDFGWYSSDYKEKIKYLDREDELDQKALKYLEELHIEADKFVTTRMEKREVERQDCQKRIEEEEERQRKKREAEENSKLDKHVLVEQKEPEQKETKKKETKAKKSKKTTKKKTTKKKEE